MFSQCCIQDNCFSQTVSIIIDQLTQSPFYSCSVCPNLFNLMLFWALSVLLFFHIYRRSLVDIVSDTTRYWRLSWTAIAISASITTKLATPRTRMMFGDRVFAPASPQVKKVFPTDRCALTMVEKTELRTSAVYRWQYLVKLLSRTRHSGSSHSCPCQRCWQSEWLLNSFAPYVNFDDINCWWRTCLFYTYCLTNLMVKVLRHRDRERRFSTHIVFTLRHLWCL